MSEPAPPFIFNSEGDVQFYASPRDLVASFEPDDLPDLKNKVAYDSEGYWYLLSLSDLPQETYLRKWNFGYPCSLYQLDEKKEPQFLHRLLIDWHRRLREYCPKKQYPDLSSATTTDILAFAAREHLIKGETSS